MAIFPGSFALALETTTLDNILSLLWLLICVLSIVVLAYLFTKYVAGRNGSLFSTGGGAAQFKVLARLPLGRDQSLVLVQAGERYLLLGAAPSGVTLTAELSPEEAKALYQPPSDQPPPPSFAEALRTVLKQKKPR